MIMARAMVAVLAKVWRPLFHFNLQSPGGEAITFQGYSLCATHSKNLYIMIHIKVLMELNIMVIKKISTSLEK